MRFANSATVLMVWSDSWGGANLFQRKFPFFFVEKQMLFFLLF
jgi:hypothetical protein